MGCIRNAYEMGSDMDKDYLDSLVTDHERQAMEFQAAAKDAVDPEVKAFAQKAAQAIQLHVATIKAARSKLK